MADLYETVNQLSVLLGARRPQWVNHLGPFPNGIPDTPSSGVSLQNSPRTQIAVDLREEAHRRTVRITVPVVDLLVGVYTVIIDAVTVSYDAAAETPADAAALVQGIADKIAADVAANLIVQAAAIDSTGSTPAAPVDTILLRGIGEADYAVALSVVGGAGELSGVADASSASARVWFALRPPLGAATPGTWRQANGATYAASTRGFIERFDTAGLDRGYVELLSVVGDAGDGATPPSVLTYAPIVTLGPSVLETE